MADEVPAYFTSSSAFDIAADARVSVIARYAEKDALMSGWMLGEKYLNGKAALVETAYGKGKIVMFAFRPQHRGQTWGTFPFIFNVLERSTKRSIETIRPHYSSPLGICLLRSRGGGNISL